MASITLHFPDSFGGDTTKIEYIGFKGEATQVIAHTHSSRFCCFSSANNSCPWLRWTVEEGCCCNHCLWTQAKSFWSQVSFLYPSEMVKQPTVKNNSCDVYVCCDACLVCRTKAEGGGLSHVEWEGGKWTCHAYCDLENWTPLVYW